MKALIRRLSHPFRGLKYALMHDFAVRFEVFVFGGIGLPAAYFFFGPFSAREMLLLIFCWFFVVVAELQNSAIEVALDKIHPERHEAIGRSKDLAAAAVVWASFFGIISFIFVVTGLI
ncbi:MAG TPA: diacylglycerol kinase [Candidatus Paceibacterota bacterium]|nr:diacylglycerol kinase [Candidatus Paceibacterota bacterium]